MISHLAHVRRRRYFVFHVSLIVLLMRAVTVINVRTFERLRESIGRTDDIAILVLDHGWHGRRVLPNFLHRRDF